jgi:hypothetical protein
MMPKAVQRAKPVTVRQYILAEIASVSPVRTTFQTCGTKLQTEQTEARYPMMSAASMRHAGRFLGLLLHLANVQHHDFEPTLAIHLDMRAENTEPTAATPPGSPEPSLNRSSSSFRERMCGAANRLKQA